MRTPVSCSPMLLVGGPTVGRMRHLKLQQQVRKAQHSHYGMSPAYSIPVLPPEPTFQPPTTHMHLCHARRCCSPHASTAASWASFLGGRQQHAYMLGVSLQDQAPWGTPIYLHATCCSSKLLIPLLSRDHFGCCGCSGSLVRIALASPPPLASPTHARL